MENSPLVSVIIPVYNVEDFVDRCLFSILKQSYKNYEAIVVNDGSTDTSLQICKLYEKLDNRFKVYTKPNGGLSSARNYGLEQATGKYVTYVDSDDMLDIDYLKHLVDTAEKFSSDLVICDYALWWPQYQDAVQVREVPTSKKLTIGEVYSAVLTLKTSTTIATQGGYVWNKLFRFDLIKDIKFQEIKGAEDEIYMFSVLPLLKSACYINKPLYLYNQRGNSLVNRRDFFIQFLKSREKLIDLAKDAEILNLLGTVYQKLKEFDKAIGIFNNLVSLYPDNHILAVKLAECYFSIGNKEKAKEYASIALEKYPDFSDALKILKEVNKNNE